MQIDGELHVQMQATNDLKSQILMTSDNLKNATEEESKCMTAIIRLESQLHSAAILTGYLPCILSFLQCENCTIMCNLSDSEV
jgi:hypothetical protein